MTSSHKVTIGASLILVLSGLTSISTLHRVDEMRTASTLQEVLYVSSPKLLKRLSLGYEGLLADIYWTRAVQYFGSKHHAGADSYKLLAPLLEMTTYLDPHLLVAYDYGANFLAPAPPDGAGMPQRAIELIKFGIRSNPDNWQLYYHLGFVDYMDLKDYAAAAQAFAEGAKVPGAHPFLGVMAARMAEHAGETEMARMMWSTTFESTRDLSIRSVAAAHLRALQVDEAVPSLEALVALYRSRAGHLPESFLDMVNAGMLRGIPLDPLGHPYKLTSDGHVVLRDPSEFPFVRKGLPPGYVPPVAPKILPTD
jgi:tetratricopeptide (TPR) repeat protein